MDNFQVACLLAGILLLVGALRATADGANRVLFLGLILWYFTLVVLEVDTRKMDAPPWRIGVTKGPLRGLWLGGLWVSAALLFARCAPRRTLGRF